MFKPIISSDSHVCEPPGTFVDRIDKKYLDVAPHIVNDPVRGDIFQIKGVKKAIPLSLISAAGQPPESLSTKGAKVEDLHKGGWDPAARLLDQDRDGISGKLFILLSAWKFATCRIRTIKKPAWMPITCGSRNLAITIETG